MRTVSEAVWAERREVLRRLSESGVSAAAFCRQEGIPYWKLMAWQKRIRVMDEGGGLGGGAVESDRGSAFAELVVRENDARKHERVSSAPVEIVLPGGAVVRVYTGADAGLVRTAVEAAKSC